MVFLTFLSSANWLVGARFCLLWMLMASKANLQLSVKSKPIILVFCTEQEICTGFMQTQSQDFETIMPCLYNG
jgi:hypothetical protein